MPFVFLFLAATAIGGVAYGTDQRNKRIAEQAAARRAINELQQRLATLHAQLNSLALRYGHMTQQYWELAREYESVSAELERLRASMGWSNAA
ncbi:MAG TPA: hypothetical protein VEY88_06070 [Archangium sp.]|nr:hypothetical protein [Archangium sp.]